MACKQITEVWPKLCSLTEHCPAEITRTRRYVTAALKNPQNDRLYVPATVRKRRCREACFARDPRLRNGTRRYWRRHWPVAQSSPCMCSDQRTLWLVNFFHLFFENFSITFIVNLVVDAVGRCVRTGTHCFHIRRAWSQDGWSLLRWRSAAEHTSCRRRVLHV